MSGLDPRGSGRIDAGPAAEFLRKSGIETSHLRDIWDLATPNNEDFLDRDRFYFVLRLVGLAQAGQPLIAQVAIAGDNVPLPNFGYSMSNYIDHSPEKTPDVWEIPSEQEAQYESIFNKVTNNGDQISGGQVKVLFEKAQVRPESLITIWGLSDVGDKGYLTKREFIVAIHLLHKSKSGVEVPMALPQTLTDFLNKSSGAGNSQVQFDLPPMSELSSPMSNPPPQ